MLGFIGAGNMGGAILKGAINSGFLKPDEIMISDLNKELVAQTSQTYGVAAAADNCALVSACDWILLAVKPVYLQGVIQEIRKKCQGKKIISIAAGWTVEKLHASFGPGCQLLRVMPNTPALVGAGYAALCAETTLEPADLEWAKRLFGTLGKVEVLPERLFDAVTAVTGSSPAYVFMFIEAMADAAVRLGMTRPMAIEAAAQAVFGSAKMVLDTHQHPAVLKDQVCSPAGTTIEAVQALEKAGFRSAVMEAMAACADKSQAMAK